MKIKKVMSPFESECSLHCCYSLTGCGSGASAFQPSSGACGGCCDVPSGTCADAWNSVELSHFCINCQFHGQDSSSVLAYHKH